VKFPTSCVACFGPSGQGRQALRGSSPEASSRPFAVSTASFPQATTGIMCKEGASDAASSSQWHANDAETAWSGLEHEKRYACSRRSPLATAPLRALLMVLAVLLGLEHRRNRWLGGETSSRALRGVFGEGVPGMIREAEAEEAADEAPGTTSGARSFLKAGAVYQNEYMTLWNAHGVPISVTLRVKSGDRFELKVEHLNSVNGGSKAWFALQGGFRMEPLPGPAGQAGRKRLVPEPDGGAGANALVFDETLLDRASAFAYKCLQRMGGGGLLGATELEADTLQDAVLVTPKAAVVRMLWDETVALRLTSEDKLWTPHSLKEGFEGPLVEA